MEPEEQEAPHKQGPQIQWTTAHRGLTETEPTLREPAWVWSRSLAYAKFCSLGFCVTPKSGSRGCLWLFCLLLEPPTILDMNMFAYSYCILICHVRLICRRSALFWREMEAWIWLKGVQGVEGGQTLVRM